MEQDVANYLRYIRSRNYSPGTVGEYERILYGLSNFLQLPTEQVTHQSLVTYFEYLTDRQLLEATRNQHIFCIKGFFNWYCDMQDLPYSRSPAKRIDKVKQAVRIPNYYSPEQIDMLRAEVRNACELAIVETLYCTGIRASELIGLDLHHYSPSRREIKVLGKGNVERIVPITERCRLIVDNYLDWADSFRNDPDALFINIRDGERINYNHLHYILRTVSGGWARPHLFRHTAATRMIESGASIRDVQELLGHKSITSTAIYTHVAQTLRDKQEAAFGEHEEEEPKKKKKRKGKQ